MIFKIIIIFSVFALLQNLSADSNVITNVRENVTIVSQNSDVNTGIDLGDKSTNDVVVGNGQIKTEERNISNYNKIKITGDFIVNVDCNNAGKIQIKAESNIIPLITTKVADEALIVSISKPISTQKKMELNVNSAQLSVVDLIGVSNLTAKGIDTQSLNLKSFGNDGDIELDGKVQELKVNTTGDGLLDALELTAQEVDLKVTGDMRINVNAVKKLNVNVMGDAEIKYKGNPEITKKMLGGEIEKY